MKETKNFSNHILGLGVFLKWSHDVVYLWPFANTHNFVVNASLFRKPEGVKRAKTPIVQSWEAEQKHRIQKHWINTSDEEGRRRPRRRRRRSSKQSLDLFHSCQYALCPFEQTPDH
jgi:hypothetical protein